MPSSAFRLLLVWAAALALLLPVLPGCGGDDQLIVAMGTTIQDSGLADPLFRRFERATGYDLKAVAVGTGQALEMARRGDADVVFTHAPAAELEFVAEGYGIDRRLVMHNDFVIVGPIDDPAAIGGARDASDAFRRIADAEETFISRGDDSGTHKLELSFWQGLGIVPGSEDWYQEAGSGMGVTLQVAAQRQAYAITDRGTFLSLSNRLDLTILFQRDPRLLNVYHVIRVNPERVDGVNEEGARAFADFLVSAEAQEIIGGFGVEDHGRQLFVPDAGKSEDDLTSP